MKVLIVHPDKGIRGGAEEVVNKLVTYLSKTGHGVSLLYEKGPFSLWKDTQALAGKIDVINVHNFPATLAAFPIKNKPIVWMCNEPAELFTNWKRKPIEAFNRWWVRNSGMKAVVATEYDKNRFRKIYGVEPKVIPYGIDYDFWSQGKRESKQNGPIKLLQVGTITPYKNQLASIKAFARLVAGGVDATLTLAGSYTTDLDYFGKLQTYLSTPNLQRRFSYTGQVNREEIRNLYYSHDILLHPVKEQGGWLVPFEAVCTGLPVLTTTDFPASTLIVENKLGMVADDMAGMIYMEHYKELKTQEIKEWVKENLTWDRFGESMVKVFKEAINGES